MCNKLCYSVYISRFEEQKQQLTLLYREGSCVFTSFHISEEFDETYVDRAYAMCQYLHGLGYVIMGDVSKKTLEVFGETDIIHFAQRMAISIVRIDYGFSCEEIADIGAKIPLCLNASTTTESDVAIIYKSAKTVCAMHNFYPRPETGLDSAFFDNCNLRLRNMGIEVACFIPGNILLRGPLFAGLPTLEKHRGQSPYASFIDSCISHKVNSIFVGDGLVDTYEAERVDAFLKTGILDFPVIFNDAYSYLYGTIFTVRSDSPAWIMRLQESREYATAGILIEPLNCTKRERGSITIDNKKYLRYSGEIQIMRDTLSADEKVNVIGRMPEAYQLLLDNCANGKQLRFVR